MNEVSSSGRSFENKIGYVKESNRFFGALRVLKILILIPNYPIAF